MSLLDRAATRGGGPWAAGHEPLSIIHVHAHSDGHGGTHSHLHPHTGDNHHSGAGHPASPGNPDADMTGAQLNSGTPGGETRDVYAAAAAYLQREGVDVERALTVAGHVREGERTRARAAAGRARDLALDLKKADRALLFEARGLNEGAAGFDRTRLGEARERVAQLTAALEEACVNDRGLVRAARRAVA
jgi:hypothetical protein